MDTTSQPIFTYANFGICTSAKSVTTKSSLWIIDSGVSALLIVKPDWRVLCCMPNTEDTPISTGYKKEIILEKNLVARESVFWCTRANHTKAMDSWTTEYSKPTPSPTLHEPIRLKHLQGDCSSPSMEIDLAPAPSGQKIPLYNVAHSRAGDKGNHLNLSIIPHFLPDIERLKVVITPDWVKKVVSTLLDASSFADQDDINVQKGEDLINKNVQVKIYEAKGIHSLNIVINNILDGGVNCSRRIDRHGKTISDLILCQEIVLPPPP